MLEIDPTPVFGVCPLAPSLCPTHAMSSWALCSVYSDHHRALPPGDRGGCFVHKCDYHDLVRLRSLHLRPRVSIRSFVVRVDSSLRTNNERCVHIDTIRSYIVKQCCGCCREVLFLRNDMPVGGVPAGFVCSTRTRGEDGPKQDRGCLLQVRQGNEGYICVAHIYAVLLCVS